MDLSRVELCRARHMRLTPEKMNCYVLQCYTEYLWMCSCKFTSLYSFYVCMYPVFFYTCLKPELADLANETYS